MMLRDCFRLRRLLKLTWNYNGVGPSPRLMSRSVAAGPSRERGEWEFRALARNPKRYKVGWMPA